MSIEIDGVVYEDNAPEALQAKVVKLETEKSNLVAEITTDRTKNREAITAKEAEIETLKGLLKEASDKNTQAPTEEEKIAQVVKAMLTQKEGETAVLNKKSAFEKFVNEHTEYHPDNDPGGLKRSALEKEFNGFNTGGLFEVDDFVTVVGKADRLLRDTDTSRQPDSTYVPSTPSSGTAPKSTPVDQLSQGEKELIARNGWTVERYLKLKTSMPGLADTLLSPVAR